MGKESHGRKLTRPVGASGRTLARSIGRGAIWATLALLLVRGVGSVLSPTRDQVAATHRDRPGGGQAADAFAIHFARAYLSDPTAESLAPFLAEGAGVGTGLAPTAATAAVAQAEVSGTEERGDGESVLTVACELRDSRTLYLAVPIVRSGAGEVAALGAPWFVAGPGSAAGTGSDRPRPLAGSEGPAIESLVERFLPAYLASGEADELSYLLKPGVVVQPLGGQVTLKGLGTVSQLGDGEGPRRTVVVGVRAGDPTGGATYPLVYRISVERVAATRRWYVAAIEGASA